MTLHGTGKFLTWLVGITLRIAMRHRCCRLHTWLGVAQKYTLPSWVPAARTLPSVEKVQQSPLFRGATCTGYSSSILQNLTILSSARLATCSPSWLKHTERTQRSFAPPANIGVGGGNKCPNSLRITPICGSQT